VKRICWVVPFSISLFSTGCLWEPAPEQEKASLSEARRGFVSKLIPAATEREPVPEPPPNIFRKVVYDSPVGKLQAYISQVPDDGKKRPAIIWITGGDCNTIDGSLWHDAPPSNDQTAAAYRKAGIVLMFPSLRGGNDNPGTQEAFLGEVDDVLAAADYLARDESLDPKRIYLGGHSTGGTLALLVAESTDRFRAVFSFGPVSNISGYGSEYTPFDTSNHREVELRSPGRWLGSIRGPTFVIEGKNLQGNFRSVDAMRRASTNPMVHFLGVRGADHFSVLAPVNQLIATKILADTGPTTTIAFTEEELGRLMR
jgi:acetyl esterase/lipase